MDTEAPDRYQNAAHALCPRNGMRIKTERKEGDGNDNQKQHEHQRQAEPKPPPQVVCTHIGEQIEPYSIQDGKSNSSDERLL